MASLAGEATAGSRVRPLLGQPTSAMMICLSGKGLFEQGDLVVDIVDGGFADDALPVGQHVDGEEVDVLDQFRMSSQTCQGSAVLTGCLTASRTRSR